jgi:predicted Zn-dependent protease
MEFVAREPEGDHNPNVSPTSPLREPAVLFAGISVAIVVLLTIVFFVTDAVALAISPATEARTFAAITEKLPGGDGPCRDELQQLIDALVADATAASGPDGYTHALSVIDGPPNAMAVIGGRILVTRGLLADLESENDLAFVLGHELGHFAHRDQVRGLGRKLVGSLLLGAVFGTAYDGDTPGFLDRLEELQSKRAARQQESDADRFALRLLARRYGHADGATTFFARMRKHDGERFAWFSTHPPARIASTTCSAGPGPRASL